MDLRLPKQTGLAALEYTGIDILYNVKKQLPHLQYEKLSILGRKQGTWVLGWHLFIQEASQSVLFFP